MERSMRRTSRKPSTYTFTPASKERPRRQVRRKATPLLPPQPSQKFYAIRRILDERCRRGETEFLVDWEDDNETGESCSPSWVPTRDVSDDAITKWLELGSNSHQDASPTDPSEANSDSIDNSQPARSPRRSRQRRVSRRQLRGQSLSLDISYDDNSGEQAGPPTSPQSIVVKCSFVDPSEFAIVDPSSQEEGGSRLQPLPVPSAQATVGIPRDRVIRDSLEPEDSLSSLPSTSIIPVSTVGDCIDAGEHLAIVPDQVDSETPSHQPELDPPGDISGQEAASDLAATSLGNLREGPLSQVGSPPSALIRESQPQPIPEPATFWTQEPLDFDVPSLGNSSDTESCSARSPSVEEDRESEERRSQAQTLTQSSKSSQAAQVVPQIGVETEVSRFSASDEDQYLAEGAQKDSTEPENHSESSFYVSCPPFPTASGSDHYPEAAEQALSLASVSKMDQSPARSTPLSFKEQLRQKQADALRGSRLDRGLQDPVTPSGKSVSSASQIVEVETAPQVEVEDTRQIEVEATPQVEVEATPQIEGEATSQVESGQIYAPASTGTIPGPSAVPETILDSSDVAVQVHLDRFDEMGFLIEDQPTNDEPRAPSHDPSPAPDVLPEEHESQMQPLVLQNSPAVEVDPDNNGTVEMEDVEPPSQGVPESNFVPSKSEYIVTLPLAANVRSSYLNVVMGARADIKAFGAPFTTAPFVPPDRSLEKAMDKMFQALWDICDLPTFPASLPELDTVQMMKHATTSGAKYSFVHELLSALTGYEKTVLLVAKPDNRIHDYLTAILDIQGCKYTKATSSTMDENLSEPTVILAQSDEDLSGHIAAANVILAFDHVARSAVINQRRKNASSERVPIFLSLIASFSIEHIDLHHPEDMDPLVRKNALVLSVVEAQSLLMERYGFKPHEIASQFGEFIASSDEDFSWEPESLPDEIVNIMSSPQSSQLLATTGGTGVGEKEEEKEEKGLVRGRKRPLDGALEEISKRPRLSSQSLEKDEVEKTDDAAALRTALAKITELEAKLAEKSDANRELEAKLVERDNLSTGLETKLTERDEANNSLRQVISNLETELKSHQKTVKYIQPKFMEALRDRGLFEDERDNAREETEKAKKRLEALAAEIKDLKATKSSARAAEASNGLDGTGPSAASGLTETSAPAEGESNPLETKVQELETKMQGLQKQLDLKERDMDYIRMQYQDASHKAAELGRENAKLRDQAEELGRRASENLRRIHELNAAAATNGSQALKWGRDAVVRGQEADLARLREELRAQRNGRRETRQSSVPRSPRMGVHSPRPLLPPLMASSGAMASAMGVGGGGGGGGGGGAGGHNAGVGGGGNGGGAGAGGNGGGGNGRNHHAVLNGSRGTSPNPNAGQSGFDVSHAGGVGIGVSGPTGGPQGTVMGLQFLTNQQPGNGGRWGHLRD